MKPTFTAHVIHTHTPAADIINFVEEYCSALHSSLGFRVQQYKQVDENHIVPVSAPENGWKATAAKIAAAASLLIPLIPLCLLAVRWAYRNCYPLTIQPPAYAHLDKHCYLKEAGEIRNIRENGVPNGELFKKLPHHFRKDLPADVLIADLYPREGPDSPYSLAHLFNPKLQGLNVINKELRQKRDQILEENFNGFKCVQGVEGLKGGIRNLLNIVLEGVVRGPYAAALMMGPGDYCAGPHGPFYIILHPYANLFNGKLNWDEDAQIAYVVPAQEHRDFLVETLEEADRRGYITSEEKLRILKKVIIYDEFIALPHNERHSEYALQQWLLARP